MIMKLRKSNFCSSVALLLLLMNEVHPGIFPVFREMKEMLKMEAILIDNLKGYIEIQEAHLQFLKRKAADYESGHNEATAVGYLTNPVNIFQLTKRLSTDWEEIEHVMLYNAEMSILENITNYRKILPFPTEEDLKSAVVAFTRLQDVYNLDTASMARGELNGIKYTSEMSLSDCFTLGRQSYINEDYYHTLLWMQEAMDRLQGNRNDKTKEDIMKYVSFSMHKLGGNKINLTNELEVEELKLKHLRATRDREFYEELDTNEINYWKLRSENGTEDATMESEQDGGNNDLSACDWILSWEAYEKLCRNEIQTPPNQLAPLRCRYMSNNKAYLKIGPIKLEELSISPYVVIYHDVISDEEIEIYKKLSEIRFETATVVDTITGDSVLSKHRVSKLAWLTNKDHEFVQRLSLRVQYITDLSVETAEELQIVNYGVGGYYQPHFDFTSEDEPQAVKDLDIHGNRIATMLFYMNEVSQGGATVFPLIHTTVWPKKGTALFWYNLYASGAGDYLTCHAGCPVLAGTKWVSTLWLHEFGQERRRPCKLYPDHL